MAEAPADLEISLERLIGRLAKPGASKEVKAILVDARRFRTLLGNWRTIQPTEEAEREMALRVEQLLRSADALVPPEEAIAPPVAPQPPPRVSSDPPARVPVDAPARVPVDAPARVPVDPPVRVSLDPPVRVSARPLTTLHSDGERDWDEPPSLIVPARSIAPSFDGSARGLSLLDEPSRGIPSLEEPSRGIPSLEEPTRAAPIATLVRAGEERAAARAAALESAQKSDPQRLRTLPDLDISGLAQMLDDGQSLGFDEEALEAVRPTVARQTRDLDALARGRPSMDEVPRRPSPTPANGRRRADAAAMDPSKSGRLSRLLIDADADGDGDDRPPARNTIARASSPPAARGDKTLIAVRPLPAPEVHDKRLVMLTDPFSTRADAYRALRRKLSGPGAPKTIAVTSAEPDEGKTMCAANLALAFRETSSERVLLLEANLKAPALAKLFGFEPPVCFARQMAKNRDLTRAPWTVVEQFEPLHVLAVDPSSKTSPLLDPVAFANALEQLVEAGYDHIIIDTPPALGGSDVNLIADAVDGIVIAAWIKKSKKSQVKKAIDQLRPATILGVVTQDG